MFRRSVRAIVDETDLASEMRAAAAAHRDMADAISAAVSALVFLAALYVTSQLLSALFDVVSDATAG